MSRTNPYGAFNFVVKSDDWPIADPIGFMECTGLDGETLPMEYRDNTVPGGTSGAYVRKLPGMERYPNVVLRRGITGHTALWQWRKKVRDADVGGNDLWAGVKANVRIELQDEKHEAIMTWLLVDAWPCKLSGPTLNARTNEIAIEQLELCCDRIEIEES